MNYASAIQFLYDLRLFGTKFGLDNAFKLAALTGNPQEKLRFIHVAGTNGKGSTCAMLESIYRHAGLRVGLFTSPHLVSFRERIQINRQLITESEVARLVGEMQSLFKTFAADTPPTFFEVITVMALKFFEEQRCDLVILETGMGGRLDATNIVTPLASVITNVQLDHQQWLGETTEQIAREKAGIIKEKIPVITGAEDRGALKVISEVAEESKSPLTIVTGSNSEKVARNLGLSLPGEHQKINAAVVLATVQALQKQIPVLDQIIRHALRNVSWPGRLQTIEHGHQKILLDGAHNPAGAQTLADALRTFFSGDDFALIFGVMRDKDFSTMIKILAPLARKIFLSPTDSDRSAEPRKLIDLFHDANPAAEISICRNLAEAFQKTLEEKFIVVTGSLHFVGEAIELLGVSAEPSERALNEWTLKPK